MSPLRELRYDRLTLTPRGSKALRVPFHPLIDPFPRYVQLIPQMPWASSPKRNKRRRYAAEGGAAAAATSEYGADDDRWDEEPYLLPPSEGIQVGYECFEDDGFCVDPQADYRVHKYEMPTYVVGPDSIRFLPPVDDGSLVVFDRWRQVYVPSPWSYWSSEPKPWQRFYLDRGAGKHARSEKELNEELWIAFLLDRGAGVRSGWWMDLERAFITSSGLDDDPHSAAAEDDKHDPAAGAPAAAPHVHPPGQNLGSGATEAEEGRGIGGE